MSSSVCQPTTVTVTAGPVASGDADFAAFLASLSQEINTEASTASGGLSALQASAASKIAEALAGGIPGQGDRSDAPGVYASTPSEGEMNGLQSSAIEAFASSLSSDIHAQASTVSGGSSALEASASSAIAAQFGTVPPALLGALGFGAAAGAAGAAAGGSHSGSESSGEGSAHASTTESASHASGSESHATSGGEGHSSTHAGSGSGSGSSQSTFQAGAQGIVGFSGAAVALMAFALL